MPPVLRWVQHDPALAEEIKALVPTFGGEDAGASAPEYCFVRDEEEGYIAAKRSADGSQLQFTDGSGSTFRVKQSRLDRGGPNFTIALSPSVLGLAFDDLVNLDELNEATILHSLRVRFERDSLHPVGTLLVSLNPFKWVHSCTHSASWTLPRQPVLVLRKASARL